jgi:hypothetical protein
MCENHPPDGHIKLTRNVQPQGHLFPMFPSCVRFLTLLGAASSSLAGVTVQKPGLTVPPEYASHKADVEKIFTTSYAAYKYVSGYLCIETGFTLLGNLHSGEL